jgi:NTP pyrophosphatase (non-canonical NTP hydrolase)
VQNGEEQMIDGLTFNMLRMANLNRLPEFRNAKGELAHKYDKWSLNDWMVAITGELGEAANVLKKIRRGDFSLEDARPKLIQEFADVIIYLDIMSAEAGIDLGEAVIETFNVKSEVIKSQIRLRRR